MRKPTGQVLRIQQNGRVTAATIAAKRRLADRGADEPGRVASGVLATTPYASIWGQAQAVSHRSGGSAQTHEPPDTVK